MGLFAESPEYPFLVSGFVNIAQLFLCSLSMENHLIFRLN
jgi:hypothetical protein